MITGKVLDRLTLHTASNQPFEVTLWDPEMTVANAAWIRRQGELPWEETAMRFEGSPGVRDAGRYRAHFAAEVSNMAASQYHRRESGAYTVLATHDEQLVGVALGRVDRQGAHIDWVAIAPQYLAGAPTPQGEMVRGIGTAMVCAVGKEITGKHIERVVLEPLDADAERFWSARGFRDSGGDVLVLDGKEEVAKLLNSCQVRPDDPVAGDCPLCSVDGFASLHE